MASGLSSLIDLSTDSASLNSQFSDPISETQLSGTQSSETQLSETQVSSSSKPPNNILQTLLVATTVSIGFLSLIVVAIIVLIGIATIIIVVVVVVLVSKNKKEADADELELNAVPNTQAHINVDTSQLIVDLEDLTILKKVGKNIVCNFFLFAYFSFE
jgi:hypothetical protein